jgi:hypothetical protein
MVYASGCSDVTHKLAEFEKKYPEFWQLFPSTSLGTDNIS